jgi:hypothetical protein
VATLRENLAKTQKFLKNLSKSPVSVKRFLFFFSQSSRNKDFIQRPKEEHNVGGGSAYKEFIMGKDSSERLFAVRLTLTSHEMEVTAGPSRKLTNACGDDATG